MLPHLWVSFLSFVWFLHPEKLAGQKTCRPCSHVPPPLFAGRSTQSEWFVDFLAPYIIARFLAHRPFLQRAFVFSFLSPGPHLIVLIPCCCFHFCGGDLISVKSDYLGVQKSCHP
jgi:hypothetical protein